MLFQMRKINHKRERSHVALMDLMLFLFFNKLFSLHHNYGLFQHCAVTPALCIALCGNDLRGKAARGNRARTNNLLQYHAFPVSPVDMEDFLRRKIRIASSFRRSGASSVHVSILYISMDMNSSS